MSRSHDENQQLFYKKPSKSAEQRRVGQGDGEGVTGGVGLTDPYK